MIARFEDFLTNDVRPAAKGDARLDTAQYARLLREGYALEEPPAELEARLTSEANVARREMDSLSAGLDPNRPAPQLLEVLKGSHPEAGEVLPAVTAVFRSAESFARNRWPGLPAAPLEIHPLDFAYRIQGQVVAFQRPRPLRAAVEDPTMGVSLVDPNWPSEVQESFLRQLGFCYDSILAARQDVPGETMLWRLHAMDPGGRLWAAGTHTFQAWGVFAQRLGARVGYFSSNESRMFESWNRLTTLARALADVRLGRREVQPEVAVAEIARRTYIDQAQCRGFVKEALENPGRQAAVACRALAYERTFDALRARGMSEAAALRKLADTALFNPSDQARLLGLAR